MRRVFPCALAACLCLMPLRATAVVVNFDDLPYEFVLTGTNYAGLSWEQGNAGYQGNIGAWHTPPAKNSNPNTPPHNVINAWGSTLIGIRFPTPVNFEGAFFASQGDPSLPLTPGVRVHGYLLGVETEVTGWFTDLDTHPDWFAVNLGNVDRIVFESIPTEGGGGWYGMDDLTYTPVPEPSSILALLTGLVGIGGIAVRKRN